MVWRQKSYTGKSPTYVKLRTKINFKWIKEIKVNAPTQGLKCKKLTYNFGFFSVRYKLQQAQGKILTNMVYKRNDCKVEDTKQN